MNCPARLVTVALSLWFLVYCPGVLAALDVDEVFIYDESVLGDAAVILEDTSVSVQEDSTPSALLNGSTGQGNIVFPVRPDVNLDCEVVEKWTAVTLYLNNVNDAVAVLEGSYSSLEGQAQGALDLAVSLLDSMDAPPITECDENVPGGITQLGVFDAVSGPCGTCATRLKNIEKRLFELDLWIGIMGQIHQNALQLVNEVVAKIANPGSFESADYACDRLRAMLLQFEVDSYRQLFNQSVASIANNASQCTLENAMASCEFCGGPNNFSLVGELGPILQGQLAAGATQRVPPDPILAGIGDALETALRTGDNPELDGLLRRLYRRLRKLAEEGRVLHAVVPVESRSSRTFVAIGRAAGDHFDAVVFTAAQRDSGLPAPNVNDSLKTIRATQAFGRRLPEERRITLRDLAENEELNRIMPDWREYFR